MKFKKIVGLSICLAMTATMLGCQKDAGNSESSLPKGEVSYPIKTDKTLTYWVRLVGALGTSVQNFGETAFAQEYMKRTGIQVKYQHPAQGQEIEVLNLLIASGDLPDIIETDWLSRDPDTCISKKTILKLNDLIENYSPNLKKYLNDTPATEKAIRTDSGNYYVYPFIRGDEKLLSTAGLMLRADWLKELNLDVPTTIDEWDNVLASLKKSKAEVPLAMGLGNLNCYAGAYNTSNDFYIDNGKVRFGSIESSYKEFLIKMNDWYKKGYIDKNFAILDNKLINANMLDGKSGATFGAGGGSMGLYLSSVKDKNPTYDLVAAPFPTLKKGDVPEFGNKQLSYSPLNGAAITGKSKNAELAARFLDYSYSQDGYMLNNFGIEGTSYNMVGGYPTYTEVITKNSNGLSMAQALPLYVRAANEGPFVQDKRYIEQYYQLKQQQNALDVWSKNNHDKHTMPQITLTQEETTEFAKIMSEIRTYRDEAIVEFIMGSQTIDAFDNYVQKIKSLKIDRAIEIEQAAYERFLNRK